MVCLLAALVLGWSVEALPGTPGEKLGHAIHALHSAKNLEAVSTWQPVADALALGIGHTRDWRRARERLVDTVNSFSEYQPSSEDDFSWYEDRRAILPIGGSRPGLLGYAWVTLRYKDRKRWQDPLLACIFWFERQARGWRGQLLGVAVDDAMIGWHPYDAVSSGDYLAVSGRDGASNIAGCGALVFQRVGIKWAYRQKVVSDAESWHVDFDRVGGRKSISLLVVKLRVYLSELGLSHGGAKRYYLESYTFHNGRYHYSTVVPVPSAVATLDDMIGWATDKNWGNLRKRCATPGLARRFVALLGKLPGDHGERQSYRFADGEEPEDDDTQFVFEGSNLRLRFRHVGRGWVLSSMRRAPDRTEQ